MQEIELVVAMLAIFPQYAVLLISLGILFFVIKERGDRIEDLEGMLDRHADADEGDEGACL